MTRFFLLLVGLSFLLLGLAYLAAPVDLALLVGMSLTSVSAVIDVQGFYGGQMTGVGLVILLALRMPWLVVPALVMIAATLGGTAAGRAFGLLTGGECPPVMAGLLALEAGTAIVAVFLLRREFAGKH